MSDVDQVEGGTHRKRRGRHALILVVAIAILGAAFYSSYSRVWGAERAAAPTRTCTPVAAAPPSVAPKLVYLNVFNASDHGGIGDKVARLLKKRHFNIIAIGNDPLGRTVPGTGQVRYGPGGTAVAHAVAAQVDGMELVRDSRADPSVDLVLGQQFTALVPLPPPPPGAFRLNVYNTTFRAGLAGDTAKELRARGFRVTSVGNDPQQAFMTEPGMLRFGEDGEPAARRVALQVKGVKMVRDNRKDSSVDLVLGSGFVKLQPKAETTLPPKPTPAPAATRAPGC